MSSFVGVDQQIGQTIRVCRKAKGIVLKQLAAYLNKSVATVSKYEKGEIAIDLQTFLEICDALDVDPAVVLGGVYTDRHESAEPVNLDPFFCADRLYLYYPNYVLRKASRSSRPRLSCAIVEISKASLLATFYVDGEPGNFRTNNRGIMHGKITSQHTMTRFYAENIDLADDAFYLSFANFSQEQRYRVGIMCSNDYNYRNRACKCLISRLALSQDEVQDILGVSSEDVSCLRKTGYLIA